MDAREEFIKIREVKNEALTKLRALEDPLLMRSKELFDKQRNGGTLTAAEADELATADLNVDRIHHTMFVIGQITLQAMNNSALLRNISNSLSGVSDDLKKAKQKLDKIAKVANITARVTSALVELAEQVGKALV